MSKRRIDSKEFKDWLHKRMTEAKLTPTEIIDFNKWLISRSEQSEEDGAASEEFKDWLQKKMAEAKLSPEEVADFNKWLVSCADEHAELEHANNNISVKDVLELVSWAKGRMTDLIVQKDERSEFSKWLTKRLSVSSGLTDDEIHGALGDL